MDTACRTVRPRNEQSAVHGVRLGGAVSALGVSNLDGRLSAPGDSVIDDVIDAGDEPLTPDSAVDLVKKDIEDGVTKDWGLFVGENRGYAIFEANEVEIGIRLQQYVPFIIFKGYAIAGVSKVDRIHKALLK